MQFLSTLCKALHLIPNIMSKLKRCKHHLKLDSTKSKSLISGYLYEELKSVYLKYCNAVITSYIWSHFEDLLTNE